MRSAVVIGGSGFLGTFLCRELVASGYEVLAIGRSSLHDLSITKRKRLQNCRYIKCDINDEISLSTALEKFCRNTNDGAEIQVYYLAWSGESKLSDLNTEAQLKNVLNTMFTFKVCQRLNIDKFVFAGTMEECFAEKYTRLDYKKDDYYNRHVIYALAKIAAKNALRLAADSKKTRVFLTTNSHIMGPDDDKDSFLQVTLQRLLKHENLSMTSGKQLFDVIDVRDCAKAYRLIAERGKPLKDYWVGSGSPQQLKHYVSQMAKHVRFLGEIERNQLGYQDIRLTPKVFSTFSLLKDTGFEPTHSFEDTVAFLKESFSNEKI